MGVVNAKKIEGSSAGFRGPGKSPWKVQLALGRSDWQWTGIPQDGSAVQQLVSSGKGPPWHDCDSLCSSSFLAQKYQNHRRAGIPWEFHLSSRAPSYHQCHCCRTRQGQGSGFRNLHSGLILTSHSYPLLYWFAVSTLSLQLDSSFLWTGEIPGWPKSLLGFFHAILQKNPNELCGLPNIIPAFHFYTVLFLYMILSLRKGSKGFPHTPSMFATFHESIII